MPIVATDLKTYLSEVVTDDNTNGGRLGYTEAVSGVKNNVWPQVFNAERIAGSTKYRKTFHKVVQASDITYVDAIIYLERPTAGDDEVYIFPGTQTDTQAGITGSEDLYGAGSLTNSVLTGANSIEVTVADPAIIIFRDTEKIRISNKPDVDTAGDEEFHTISGTPTIDGNVVTITIAGTLAADYSNTDTVISSVIECGDVVGNFDNSSYSSASGVFWDSELTVHSVGAEEDTITFTFTSATDFDVTGANLGALGSGNTSTDFSPNNPSTSTPYFTMLSSGWTGTWATSETAQFDMHPAAYPTWEKRIVPTSSQSLAGNTRILVFDGESLV